MLGVASFAKWKSARKLTAIMRSNVARSIHQLKRLFATDAGVVVYEFDWSEHAFALGPEALNSGVVRHIALNSQRLATMTSDRSGDRRCSLRSSS